MENQLQLRPFQPTINLTVKQLILDGLVEHWGVLDPTLNPDLNNIAQSYADGDFVVACIDGEIVGTGAIIPEEKTAVLCACPSKKKNGGKDSPPSFSITLLPLPKEKGYEQVVLETTSTWQDVIQFYLRNGFTISHYAHGDTHFTLSLCQ